MKKSQTPKLDSIEALVKHLSGDRYDRVTSLAAEIATKEGKSIGRSLADAMEKLKIPNKPKDKE